MVTVRRKRSNAVFRAIADPTRREILSLLRGGRHTVGEIAANFRTSRPAISKHLRLLRSAGLGLREYEAFWGESMRSLKNYIEENERQKGGTYESDERERHHRPGN